jgi:rod shape-determining protein MreD
MSGIRTGSGGATPIVIVARVALVIFMAIIVQVSFVAPISLFGARGDVVLLVAIAAGMEGGPERGAVTGFAAGLTFDLLLSSPAGLSALTYCLVGYAVGNVSRSVLRTSWWIPPMITAVASAGGVLLYAALDVVFGQVTVDPARLPAIVVMVTVVNVALNRPVRWALRHAFAHPARERLSL